MQLGKVCAVASDQVTLVSTVSSFPTFKLEDCSLLSLGDSIPHSFICFSLLPVLYFLNFFLQSTCRFNRKLMSLRVFGLCYVVENMVGLRIKAPRKAFCTYQYQLHSGS